MSASSFPAYVSTRGSAPEVDFVGALLAGVAPDGGLYVPTFWPDMPRSSAASGGSADLANAVLAPFVGDVLEAGVLGRATARLTSQFRHPETTPLIELAPGLFVLELFHGPTAAFKDYAMQMVAEVMEEIGWQTRLIDLSEPQVFTLIEVAIGGFQDAMREIAAANKQQFPEVPF